MTRESADAGDRLALLERVRFGFYLVEPVEPFSFDGKIFQVEG